MKRILYLTFYFEPDLCAGSFRNSPLVIELAKQFKGEITVITTVPNRYSTFQIDAPEYEERGNVKIHRILIPKHQSGFVDQIKSFKTYYTQALSVAKKKKYDFVFASTSRLFTGYLGYKIARKNHLPLYLDVRDIFTDTLEDVLKNKALKTLMLPLLRKIENRTFNYASHINLVSEGFKDYFDRYKNPTYSFYSNGIDNQFLDLPATTINNDIKIITYAGNIGEGQGLHKIVPQAASKLGNKYKFLIIGAGGQRQKLIETLDALKVTNVEVINPVKRNELLEIYLKSDFLFLHLNDYPAFKKVLPSKVFELGAFDKPIIAGVAGYANEFINKNIDNKILFSPNNVDDLIYQLQAYKYKTNFRKNFIEKFKRNNIDKRLAASIISIYNEKSH